MHQVIKVFRTESREGRSEVAVCKLQISRRRNLQIVKISVILQEKLQEDEEKRKTINLHRPWESPETGNIHTHKGNSLPHEFKRVV